MKIKDVTQSNAAALYEAIDAENNTGIATERLVEMADAHNSTEWTSYSSVDELMEAMRKYRSARKQDK